MTDTTLTGFSPSTQRPIARGELTVGHPMMVARPTIVRNPANDRAFQQAIDEILDSDVTEPAAVQERLREWYPRAVVRPRELDAERIPVWYVYREGRWTPGD